MPDKNFYQVPETVNVNCNIKLRERARYKSDLEDFFNRIKIKVSNAGMNGSKLAFE